MSSECNLNLTEVLSLCRCPCLLDCNSSMLCKAKCQPTGFGFCEETFTSISNSISGSATVNCVLKFWNTWNILESWNTFTFAFICITHVNCTSKSLRHLSLLLASNSMWAQRFASAVWRPTEALQSDPQSPTKPKRKMQRQIDRTSVQSIQSFASLVSRSRHDIKSSHRCAFFPWIPVRVLGSLAKCQNISYVIASHVEMSKLLSNKYCALLGSHQLPPLGGICLHFGLCCVSWQIPSKRTREKSQIATGRAYGLQTNECDFSLGVPRLELHTWSERKALRTLQN